MGIITLRRIYNKRRIPVDTHESVDIIISIIYTDNNGWRLRYRAFDLNAFKGGILWRGDEVRKGPIMKTQKSILIALIIAMLTLSLSWFGTDARAKVRLSPTEYIEATEEQIEEINSFFDSLERAIIREDLDRVMTFYSEEYFHRGITKTQVRRLWADIFRKYDNLKSVHVFSNIKYVDDEEGFDEGLVVCTGTLLGVPAGSKDKRHITIDSWTQQNHYLYREKGSWKITGGSSHRMMEDKSLIGKTTDRPLGFHPLY
jgi:hypothetical protein